MAYRKGRTLNRSVFLLFLFLPSVAVLSVVVVYPIVQSIIISFRQYSLFNPFSHPFVGLNNYIRVFQDPIFWEALKNTLVFNLASVIGGFLIGLGFALLLNSNIRFRNFFRTIIIAPWVVPYVVIGFLFMYMFNAKIGIANYTLQQVGLIEEFIPWLADPAWAMFAVILANIWNQFPFHAITLLAGLQAIPNDVVEAAHIDGANGWQLFRYITIPYLKNIIAISTTLMMIQNFNNFAFIWTMTEGGPVNSTTTFVIYVFRKAFTEFDFGYASALGIIWLVVLMLFAYFYMRMMEGDLD